MTIVSHTPIPRVMHLDVGDKVRLVRVPGLHVLDHFREDGYATLTLNGRVSLTCALSHPIEEIIK